MSRTYNRYFAKDVKVEELTVDKYRGIIKEVLENYESFNDVFELVKEFNRLGLNEFSESNKFYLDVVGKNKKAAFTVDVFKLFNAKYDVLKLDYKSFDREQIIHVLKFFRFINTGVNNITDDMLEEIFDGTLYANLTAVEVQESIFDYDNERQVRLSKNQDSFVKVFTRIVDSKANIDVKIGRSFVNNYGNHMNAVKVILGGKKGNAEFIIYVPMMINGVYSLRNNTFTMTKLVEDYILNQATNKLVKIVRSVIDNVLSMTQAYYISKENQEMLRVAIQTNINGLLYAKRIIKPTKMELDLLPGNPDPTDYEYEFAPFQVTTHLTDFEKYAELHKVYYKEFVKTDKASGMNLLQNFGKKGLEKYKNFDLNNAHLGLFDPSYINSKADFHITWTNTNKNSLIELTDPFNMFNFQSFRNAASPYVLGHAMELSTKPHQELTKMHDESVDIPSYNMWFLFKDHTDDYGLSTYDGQRLISTKEPLVNDLHECIKIAFPALDKGISRITNDVLYFYHNGNKVYLNVTSPINMSGRKNYGVLLSGLYNGKKLLDGNTDLEVRNFNSKPLLEEELLPLQDIYKESLKGEIYMGKRPVGLMRSYFVHEIDSTFANEDIEESETTVFKKYHLGSEWMIRAELLGAFNVVKYLIGTQDQRELQESIVTNDKTITKKFGKRGAIMRKVYEADVYGFSSTVSANRNLPLNEARAYLTESEAIELYNSIRRVDNITLDDFLSKVNNGFYKLPASLSLRNPSIDNANTIYVKTYVTISKSKYIKHGYTEINPITWARQGGDFDGDQLILLFFPRYLDKELREFFSIELRGLPKAAFEDKIALYGNLGYSDLTSFINYIGVIKKNQSYADEQSNVLFNLNGINHQTSKQVLIAASSNLVTTRLSKQLVGISKTITIKALFFIKEAMEHYGVNNKEFNQRLMDYCDGLNEILVQASIDIQKWSDDLQKVVELSTVIYKMSEAIGLLIEGMYYPTYRTFEVIKKALLKINALTKVETQDYTFYKMKLEKSRTIKFGNYILDRTIMTNLFRDNTVFKYAPKEDAKFIEVQDPNKLIVAMIEYLNPDGEILNRVRDEVENQMEGFNAEELFFCIK